MEIIYDKTTKGQAVRVCELVTASVGNYRRAHRGRPPVKILMTGDLLKVLWMASDDGDEFLRLLETGGMRIAGVPIGSCKGRGKAYYLAEREQRIHIKGSFEGGVEDDKGKAPTI